MNRKHPPHVLIWMLLFFFGQEVRADGLGVIHVVSVDDFGHSISGVAVSVQDHSGRVISDLTEKLPYGNYKVEARRGGFLGLDRGVDLDQPVKTVFAYFPGYYGDYTQLPVIPVAVSGLPKDSRVFVRAFSLYGNFARESELDVKGTGVIPDVTPGIYIITVFSSEQVLAQGVARIEPGKRIPFLRFRIKHTDGELPVRH